MRRPNKTQHTRKECSFPFQQICVEVNATNPFTYDMHGMYLVDTNQNLDISLMLLISWITLSAFLQSHGFALPEVMLGTGFTRFPAFSSWSIDLLQTRKTLLACAVRTLRIISAPPVRPKRRPYELLEPQVAALATSAQGMKTRNSSAEYFQTKETLRCRTPSTHLDCRSCKCKLINRI